MKKIVKKQAVSIKKLIEKVSGLNIKKCTAKEEVVKLIRKLHPIKTQFDLIRIGPNGDGGYLVPNDLDDIKACFSPGIGSISEFELWCLNHGMKIYLADKSVDEVNLDISKNKYNFIKKFVGCSNNKDYITLDTWVDNNIAEDNTELLLQMDIEGGEYESLISISDSLMKRFRILVIEFHYLKKLWSPLFFKFAKIVFNKILQTHSCVHIHPNNCDKILSRNGIQLPEVAEFTFLRKDRISSSLFENKFPHALDYDNTTNKHITLPKDWYRSS